MEDLEVVNVGVSDFSGVGKTLEQSRIHFLALSSSEHHPVPSSAYLPVRLSANHRQIFFSSTSIKHKHHIGQCHQHNTYEVDWGHSCSL